MRTLLRNIRGKVEETGLNEQNIQINCLEKEVGNGSDIEKFIYL